MSAVKLSTGQIFSPKHVQMAAYYPRGSIRSDALLNILLSAENGVLPKHNQRLPVFERYTALSSARQECRAGRKRARGSRCPRVPVTRKLMRCEHLNGLLLLCRQF